MESENEKEKLNLDPKLIWLMIIFLMIGVIIGVSFLIYFEIKDAKKSCEDIPGNYSLKSFQHYCNEKLFIKKSFCEWNKCEVKWGFNESLINFNQFLK